MDNNGSDPQEYEGSARVRRMEDLRRIGLTNAGVHCLLDLHERGMFRTFEDALIETVIHMADVNERLQKDIVSGEPYSPMNYEVRYEPDGRGMTARLKAIAIPNESSRC
jgi:hypothetical protein